MGSTSPVHLGEGSEGFSRKSYQRDRIALVKILLLPDSLRPWSVPLSILSFFLVLWRALFSFLFTFWARNSVFLTLRSCLITLLDYRGGFLKN